MGEKMNLSEILKRCPKGAKLYSPIFGECTLKTVGDHIITVVHDKYSEHSFYSDGSYCVKGECLLFPSKDQRDWSKFQIPFEDGDVISNGAFIAIFHKVDKGHMYYHCRYNPKYNEFKAKIDFGIGYVQEYKHATKEEKQKLLDVIGAYRYNWNDQTKTLEKLITPKFKVGNRVKKNKDYISGIVTDIFNDSFKVTYEGGGCSYVQFHCQHDWELVSDKFDISSLKPFESRVLVRDMDNHEWRGQFFSHYDRGSDRPYICIGQEGLSEYRFCIPYEGNEHLLGKNDSCDEFYKTW